MERKVPGTSNVGLTRSAAAASLVGLLFAFSAPAHSTGAAAGATEITQIMNNAELIAQVGEATQTTANTLMTAQSTMQQLRNLPNTVLDKALGGLPVEQVRAMADAYVVMNQATGVYKDAENVLRKAQYDAERLNISPSELLYHKANAAAMHGGVYKQAYEEEQAKLARAAEMSKEVQKQAEIVKGIDSTVGGIQALASQNMAMQATMAGVQTSIARANELAFIEAKKAKDADAERSRVAAKSDEEFRRNQKKAQAARDAMSSDGLIPRR